MNDTSVNKSRSTEQLFAQIGSQKKALLERLCQALSDEAEQLSNVVKNVTPAQSILVKQSVKYELENEIAETAICLMRVCAVLDINLMDVIDDKLNEQLAVNEKQQSLSL